MQIKWYHSYTIIWYIITRFLYSYVSFLYVTWSRNLLKLHSTTSKKTIGGNTYKNEMVTYLHMTWPNHAKLIKAAAPKIALMKGTHLNRQHDFWLYDILATSSKAVRHQIWQKKTQKIMYLFFRCKIYMINAASWNELKLLGSYGIFCQRWRISGRLNCYIFILFLKQKR